MESFTCSNNATDNLHQLCTIYEAQSRDPTKGIPPRADSDCLLKEHEQLHAIYNVVQLLQDFMKYFPGPIQGALQSQKFNDWVKKHPLIVALCNHGTLARLPEIPEGFPTICPECETDGLLERKTYKKEGRQGRPFLRVSS